MFSWSKTNKTGKSNGNRSSMSNYTRQQHIASYLTDPTLKPSTRKINDTTFDTVFQTKESNALILRVHMPSSLIISCPKMSLVGIRAVHPWIDSKMKVVGYPSIQSDKAFVSSGILLAQAVNHVVHHLQINPPTQLVFMDAALKSLQVSIRGSVTGGASNASNATSSNASIHNAGASHKTNGNQPPPYGSQFQSGTNAVPPSLPSQQHQQQPPAYKLPPHFRAIITLTENDYRQQIATLQNLELPKTPSTFPSQDALERTKLTLMRDDPATHLVPNLMPLPIVQETADLQHTMVESNSNLATYALEKKSELLEVHAEVKNLQSSLKEKMDQMNNLQRKQMELCKPMDTKKILHKLKKAKKESLEESEELAMEWLDGDDAGGKVNEFLDRFLEIRTVHHVRAAKMERIENPSWYR